MKVNRWIIGGVVAAMLAGLVGSTLIAQAAPVAQDSTPTPTPTPTATPTPPLERPHGPHKPRWFAGLFRNAARHAHFDQFMGGELRFKNDEGQMVTVAAIPGVVTAIGENKITIKANDGSAPEEFIFKPGDENEGRSLEAHLRRIEVGDKVIVVTVNGEPKWVVKVMPPHRPSVRQHDVDKDNERAEQRRQHIEERLEKAKQRAEELLRKAEERAAKDPDKVKERLEKARERAKEMLEKAKERAEKARAKAKEQAEKHRDKDNGQGNNNA